ncbi:hypothetical protein DJICPGNB_25960 [Escherichia coli]|nr:hypothetical protein DJICPGNB_25960 [Escherichia coli]
MFSEMLLQDELDRKTTEALIRVADEHSRSLMSDRDVWLFVPYSKLRRGLLVHKWVKPLTSPCLSSVKAVKSLCFLCI